MAAALLDNTTNFASGEEAVRAIFPDNDAKGEILTNAWNIEQLRRFYP